MQALEADAEIPVEFNVRKDWQWWVSTDSLGTRLWRSYKLYKKSENCGEFVWRVFPTTLILGGWVLVEILLLFAGMVGSRYIQDIVVYPPASSSSNSDCRLKSDCWWLRNPEKNQLDMGDIGESPKCSRKGFIAYDRSYISTCTRGPILNYRYSLSIQSQTQKTANESLLEYQPLSRMIARWWFHQMFLLSPLLGEDSHVWHILIHFD